MSNIRLLKKTIVSSSVNSVNLDNIFSEDFDKYIININNLHTSSATYLHGRVIDFSGRSANTAEYNYATLYSPSTSTSATEERGVNKTEWESLGYQGAGADYNGMYNITISNPADSTKYTFYQSHCVGVRSTPAVYLWKSVGMYSDFEAIGGLELFPRAGTLDGGVFHVYGVGRN